MYKQKLFYFGFTTALILVVALICTAVTSQLTRSNLKQSTIAQTLLTEHLQLSSTSYRMFKQLTDEVIFGQNANQAEVRKKQTLIAQSLANIRNLEVQQRDALGVEQTLGSVEDTDELERLIKEIVEGFNNVMREERQGPIGEQQAFRELLEVTIDNEFREAINAAVARQSRVVAAINAKIDTLNTAMVWFTIGVAALALPLISYGCYWLFNQFYQPLILIREAMNSITASRYENPISMKLDDEFEELSFAINNLAERLKDNELNVAIAQQQLETEVEQRTKELTAANYKLTKIDARRRQFIADVSHELRTPLTIIRGEAQVTLRLKSAAEEDYKETLSVILAQSVNLSGLVDDLLTLTRAEMDELKLQKEQTSLITVAESELNKWQRLHQARKFVFNSACEDNDAVISIDKSRIQQVLSILLDNATKYSSDESPIELNLFNQITESGNKYLCISIIDHGDGITAAERENIFERFVRFSKHSEGIGLGLPIAKAIIEAHDGKIDVVSTQGEGATFTVYLKQESI